MVRVRVRFQLQVYFHFRTVPYGSDLMMSITATKRAGFVFEFFLRDSSVRTSNFLLVPVEATSVFSTLTVFSTVFSNLRSTKYVKKNE